MNLQDFKDYLQNTNYALFDTDAYNAQLVSNSFMEDLWYELIPNKSVIPTTAVICNRNTSGAINSEIKNSDVGKKLHFIGANIEKDFNDTAQSLFYRSYILIDRLSHQGGILLNTSSPQTVNLPTAALTRYTDGAGVMAGYIQNELLTIGTAVGTISITYTNQDGVGSRVSPGGIYKGDSRAPSVFGTIPLQSGDTGVRSVESVTITLPASSAGSCGIVLFKPLAIINTSSDTSSGQCNFVDGGIIGGIPEIADDACLDLLGINPPTGAAGAKNFNKSNGVLYFYES
jgi:hypothetical protein